MELGNPVENTIGPEKGLRPRLDALRGVFSAKLQDLRKSGSLNGNAILGGNRTCSFNEGEGCCWSSMQPRKVKEK